MVGTGGFEPPTPRLSSVCSNQLSYAPSKFGTLTQPEVRHPTSHQNGGARRDRTDDLLNANQALFQLSYGPEISR